MALDIHWCSRELSETNPVEGKRHLLSDLSLPCGVTLEQTPSETAPTGMSALNVSKGSGPSRRVPHPRWNEAVFGQGEVLRALGCIKEPKLNKPGAMVSVSAAASWLALVFYGPVTCPRSWLSHPDL